VKVVLVAAVTADGYIAQRTKQTSLDWTSAEDKRHFVETTKLLGTLVVGSTTFSTIGRGLPGRRMIVMTSHPERVDTEGVEAYTGSAGELVHRLEGEGVEALAVIGGAHVYGQFLAAKLADELMLTVEPHLFGVGISLADVALDAPMRLLEMKRLGESNSVVLHYKLER
jgi:dihydrofolate reductase